MFIHQSDYIFGHIPHVQQQQKRSEKLKKTIWEQYAWVKGNCKDALSENLLKLHVSIKRL